jgi:hypothetical protein
MFFKIQCYILDIKNNDMIISITNKDELDKFHKNLIRLYKNPEDFNFNKQIFKIKYNNNSKFDINFKYKNIKDLKGINVCISGQSKYYCFSYNDEIINELTNNLETIKKIKRGYILIANKIIN